MFYIPEPSLSFIGLQDKSVPWLQIYYQSLYITKLITKEIPWPNLEEMNLWSDFIRTL